MKVKIHPLFLAAGLMSAVFGGLPVFLICALTALLHECGHIFYAARLGFCCTGVKIMPYGASAAYNLEGISPADDIKLALAGPFVNLAVCVAVAGLWWFYPDSYAYTDLVFYANAAMLLLNLLPAYPLDGGRVLRCVLKKLLPPRASDIVMRATAAATAAAVALIAALWVKNYSLMLVALFLLCSAFEKNIPAQKINYRGVKKKRGKEIKNVIMGEEATYKDALRFIDGNKYLVVQIYGDSFIDEITEDELYDRLLFASLYDRIIPPAGYKVKTAVLPEDTDAENEEEKV